MTNYFNWNKGQQLAQDGTKLCNHINPLSQNQLPNKLPNITKIWLRFMDDAFMIQKDGEQQLSF